ncbi:hypothetical protein OAI77_06395 [Candidatus Nitrosopelagicus sp.]|nr:hypothetical protein [Candidatus Nitrosopelagicus sp.]
MTKMIQNSNKKKKRNQNLKKSDVNEISKNNSENRPHRKEKPFVTEDSKKIRVLCYLNNHNESKGITLRDLLSPIPTTQKSTAPDWLTDMVRDGWINKVTPEGKSFAKYSIDTKGTDVIDILRVMKKIDVNEYLKKLEIFQISDERDEMLRLPELQDDELKKILENKFKFN